MIYLFENATRQSGKHLLAHDLRRLNPPEFFDRFLDPKVRLGSPGSKTPAPKAFCRVTLR